MPVDPTNTYTATYNYYGYTYTSVVDKFVTLYGALGAHYKYALTARMENSCTSGTDANCVTPDSGSGLNATNGIFQDWMYDGGANYLILGPKS